MNASKGSIVAVLVLVFFPVLVYSADLTLRPAAPVSVAGIWHYAWQPQGPNGGAITQGNVKLTQTGSRVSGTAQGWRFVGTVTENKIDLSVVVEGEEVEGYVLHAEGHVRGKQLFAVYTDVHGTVGSFTALRQ